VDSLSVQSQDNHTLYSDCALRVNSVRRIFPQYVEEKYFDKIWQAHPTIVVFGILFYILGQGLVWIYLWLGKSDSLKGVRIDALNASHFSVRPRLGS